MGVLRRVTNDDRGAISYRPKWRDEVGSVTATILLQQVSYRFEKNGDKPFYKFKEPCEHNLYRPGDSWVEELGFSRNEFDTALQRIGQKVSQKTPRDQASLVWYWVTPDRVTWYELNILAYESMLERIYVNPQSSVTKSDNPAIEVEPESSVTKSDNPALYITENTTENTKNTTEGRDLIQDPRSAQPVTPPPPSVALPAKGVITQPPQPTPASAPAPIPVALPTPPVAAPLPAQAPPAIGVVTTGDLLMDQAVARFQGNWQRPEQRHLDDLKRQVTGMDMSMTDFRQMVDAFLDKYGRREMAALTTDIATKTLSKAQDTVLSLCGIDPRFRSVAGMETVFVSWRENDYRGQTLPDGNQLVEHAGKMKAGCVVNEQTKGQSHANTTNANHRNSRRGTEQSAHPTGPAAADLNRFSHYNRNRANRQSGA